MIKKKSETDDKKCLYQNCETRGHLVRGSCLECGSMIHIVQMHYFFKNILMNLI